MEFARNEIDKAMTHRPFQPAVAPMDAAVGALELVGEVGLGHRLARALEVGGDQRNRAHPLFPGRHAAKSASESAAPEKKSRSSSSLSSRASNALNSARPASFIALDSGAVDRTTP